MAPKSILVNMFLWQWKKAVKTFGNFKTGISKNFLIKFVLLKTDTFLKTGINKKAGWYIFLNLKILFCFFFCIFQEF